MKTFSHTISLSFLVEHVHEVSSCRSDLKSLLGKPSQLLLNTVLVTPDL